MRVAIVMGSAGQALEEFEAARAFLAAHSLEAHAVCVNAALNLCPIKPVAFATVQGGNIPLWLTPETDIEGVKIFTRRGAHGVASYVVRAKWLGTSGLYGVQIALEELGFDGVILAGVPIDAAAGTLCAHSLMTDADRVERYRPEWMLALPTIGARTRSMSGWTREILGEPTSQWLKALTPPTASACA